MRAEGVKSVYKENNVVKASVNPLIKLLNENNIAIEQLPCPEVKWEGLKRPASGLSRYDNESYKKVCKEIADEVVNLIKEYIKNGIEVVGIVGVNGSPSCGVEFTSNRIKSKGIFMKILDETLKNNGIYVKFVGFRAKTNEELIKSLERVRSILDNT